VGSSIFTLISLTFASRILHLASAGRSRTFRIFENNLLLVSQSCKHMPGETSFPFGCVSHGITLAQPNS